MSHKQYYVACIICHTGHYLGLDIPSRNGVSWLLYFFTPRRLLQLAEKFLSTTKFLRLHRTHQMGLFTSDEISFRQAVPMKDEWPFDPERRRFTIPSWDQIEASYKLKEKINTKFSRKGNKYKWANPSALLSGAESKRLKNQLVRENPPETWGEITEVKEEEIDAKSIL